MAGTAVTAVLAVLVGLVAVKLSATPARPVAIAGVLRCRPAGHHRSGRRADQGESRPGDHPLQTIKTSGPPLTIGGKPAIVFVSEESCPFRAAERWSLAVALSHFGTWSHLGFTTSSAADVYPSTAMLSFRTTAYHSTELTLRTTELADNAGRRLQAQSPLDTRLIGAFDIASLREQRRPVRGGPVPRHRQPVHPGGRAVQPPGTGRPDGGPDRQPAQQPVEPGGRAIDGSAQVIIATLDQILHDKSAPLRAPGVSGG